MWLDPRLHDTASSSTEDKQIVGLARFTASMLAIYSIRQVPGLDVDAGMRYTGRRATDNANDSAVSGYTTVDVGSSYRTRLFGTDTTFRLSVTNLTDRHYWTNIVPGALNGYTGAGNASAQPGAPREARHSMQVDF